MVIALCAVFVAKSGEPQRSYWKIWTDPFANLELDQFTIAGVLCASHQLYNSILLWIAVWNGANLWYSVMGISCFVGVLSIPYPGICFKQFVYYAEKEKLAQDGQDDAGVLMYTKCVC